jgi:hypothetical protein
MYKVIKPPTWYTTLRIDSMYFHAANISYSAAKEAIKGIEKARENFDLLRQGKLTFWINTMETITKPMMSWSLYTFKWKVQNTILARLSAHIFST